MRSCEVHGSGTENGKEYTVVELAYWFHSLPHMKFTLRLIDNTIFNYGETQYMKSIAFWAIISLLICVFIIISYLIFSYVVYFCHSRAKNSKNSEDKDKKNHSFEQFAERADISMCWRILLIFVGILYVLNLFTGIYGIWKLYVGLGSLHNSTRDGVNWFKAIKDDFGEVDPMSTSRLRAITDNLREDIQKFGLFKQVLNKFIDILDMIINFVKKIDDDLIKANIPLFNLSRIDVEWIQEDIESYGNLASIGLLAIVSILAIIGLFFTFGVFYSKVMVFSTLFAIFGLILNGFLMSFGLSASIFVSDLCVDAKPFIKDQLNEWLLYQYLVECPLSGGGPISGFLGKAAKFVTTVKDISGKLFRALNVLLSTYCRLGKIPVKIGATLLSKLIPDISIPKNMSITCPLNIEQKINQTILDFNSQMRSYTQLINTFKSLADCRRINKDLYDSLNSICGDINPGIVIIYFYSIFSFICLILIVFCATYVLIVNQTKQKKSIPKKFHKKLMKNQK